MKRMKMRAILALSVALSVAGFANAGVLEKVPADAWNVVKFSNLAETNKKIAALSEKLGITFFAPQAADVLGTLKKEMKITGGLNDDGELAIVQVDPKGGNPEESFLVLIPTNDYKAFIANLPEATTEGDLTVVTKGNKPAYFADWGGYAAVSPNKELLAAPSKSLTLSKRAADKWDKSDVVVVSNFNAMRETLTAELNKAHEKASSEMPNELKEKGELDEKYHPVAIAAMEQAFGVADAFLRDAEATTIAYTISDAGVSNSLVAEFKAGSYLANTVNSFDATSDTLLGDLPAETYGSFMGFANSPAAVTKLIDDLSGPVLAKLPTDDEHSKLAVEFVGDMKKIIGQLKGMRAATLDGGSLTAPDQQIAIIDSDNPDFLKESQAMNEKYKAISLLLPEKMTGVKWTQTYTAGAKTIDGLSFDLVKTEIVGEGAEQDQAREMIKMTRGTDVMENYVGTVGKKIIAFSSASDETVSSLIASVKAGGSPLASKDNVKLTSDALPKPRVAEFYLAGEPIFKTALRMAPLFMGMPLPNDMQVQLPPDLPPIGVVVSKQDGTLEVDSFISSDLMQAMMTAGIQLGTELMQGGGGKNNGGI